MKILLYYDYEINYFYLMIEKLQNLQYKKEEYEIRSCAELHQWPIQKRFFRKKTGCDFSA